MKILNLYAGIGGNRKLWGDEHQITAVELDPTIAYIYKDLFPKDNVVFTDAHKYLEEHYEEFDFIWASPPCQSHSSFRQNICVRFRGTKAEYPDMRLYQEILFLKYNSDVPFIVENVKPYYTPLIQPTFELQRHLFWSNINVPKKQFEKDKIRTAQIKDLEQLYGYDLSNYRSPNKRQLLRNCVKPEVGKYILDCVMENINES